MRQVRAPTSLAGRLASHFDRGTESPVTLALEVGDEPSVPVSSLILSRLKRRLASEGRDDVPATLEWMRLVCRMRLPGFLRPLAVSLGRRVAERVVERAHRAAEALSCAYGMVVANCDGITGCEVLEVLRSATRSFLNEGDWQSADEVAGEAVRAMGEDGARAWVDSVERTSRWCSTDCLVLLGLLKLQGRVVLSRASSVVGTCALRRSLSLEDLQRCCESSVFDHNRHGVYELCDVLDGVSFSAQAQRKQASGASHDQVPLSRWSSMLLISVFVNSASQRDRVVRHVLCRLLHKSMASNSAESTLAALAQSHWMSLVPYSPVLVSWLAKNAASCTIRVAETVSAVASQLARSGDLDMEPLYTCTRSLLLSTSHGKCRTGVIMATSLLLLKKPTPEAEGPLRDRVLAILLRLATTLHDPSLSREVFNALSVVSSSLDPSESQRVYEALARFVGRLTSRPQIEDRSPDTAVVAFSPQELISASWDKGQSERPLAIATARGTMSSFLECVYQYHTMLDADTSLEQIAESVVQGTLAATTAASLLQVQSLSVVLTKVVSTSLLTTSPWEDEGTEPACQITLQCAAMSRALRLNVLNNPDATELAATIRADSLTAVDSNTAVACLPYLDRCTSVCSPKRISNRLLAERSVVFELMRTVESQAVVPRSVIHSPRVAIGHPSLVAAFPTNVTLAAVLGSPYFLRWTLHQTKDLSSRIQDIRENNPTVRSLGGQLCQLETEIVKRMYMVLRHCMWFGCQTRDLAVHVLNCMGIEASDAGLTVLLGLMHSQLRKCEDKGVAIAILDLLYVIGLSPLAQPSHRKTVAKSMREFLCSVYCDVPGSHQVRLPLNTPRVSPTPEIPIPPKVPRQWPVHYVLRCYFSLLVPSDALESASDMATALADFDPEAMGWPVQEPRPKAKKTRPLSEHPYYKALSSATLPTFYAEVAYGVSVQAVCDPSLTDLSPAWEIVLKSMEVLRQLLGLHSVVSSTLGRPLCVTYCLRCVEFVVAAISARLSRDAFKIPASALDSIGQAALSLASSVSVVCKCHQQATPATSGKGRGRGRGQKGAKDGPVRVRFPAKLSALLTTLVRNAESMKAEAMRRPPVSASSSALVPSSRSPSSFAAVSLADTVSEYDSDDCEDLEDDDDGRQDDGLGETAQIDVFYSRECTDNSC